MARKTKKTTVESKESSSRIYAYMRASTTGQDAERGKEGLESFILSAGKTISGFFAENESGSTLERPRLFDCLGIMQPGDILLVESIDRLSRMNAKDWEELKRAITGKGIRLVVQDLPTTHLGLRDNGDPLGLESRIMEAISTLIIDITAAQAEREYKLRRERQTQGIAKAKAAGRYRGRKPDIKLHGRIETMLKAGTSYTDIVETLKCGRATVAKVAANMKASG